MANVAQRSFWWMIVATVVTACGAIGCQAQSPQSPARGVPSIATTGPASRPAVAGAPEQDPTDTPAFMIHEAKLPAGFPPAGPVGKVVLKRYPASRVASVRAADVKADDDNGLFKPLFDHIQARHIAMTAPVEMELSQPDGGGKPGRPVAMGFVYPNTNVGQVGLDGAIHIADQPPLTVLSFGLRGGYGRDEFERGYGQLDGWLRAHPGVYRVTGPPRFLGYNSPFVPGFMKYGEVQIPVEPVTAGRRA